MEQSPIIFYYQRAPNFIQTFCFPRFLDTWLTDFSLVPRTWNLIMNHSSDCEKRWSFNVLKWLFPISRNWFISRKLYLKLQVMLQMQGVQNNTLGIFLLPPGLTTCIQQLVRPLRLLFRWINDCRFAGFPGKHIA